METSFIYLFTIVYFFFSIVYLFAEKYVLIKTFLFWYPHSSEVMRMRRFDVLLF